ncbi:MAG: hypothetical protein JWL73_3130 [Actinomycetia bacterium]|nr:hypothetical protein [Actinomycetes bacterium]
MSPGDDPLAVTPPPEPTAEPTAAEPVAAEPVAAELTAAPRRRRGPKARWIVLAVLALVVLWAGFAGLTVWHAKTSAQRGLDTLDAARKHLTAEDLLNGKGVGQIESARADIEHAHQELDSPFVSPLDIVPVVGRQVRSARALGDTGSRVLEAGIQALHEVRAELKDKKAQGPERVVMLRKVQATTQKVLDRLRSADLGPSKGLVGPLARGRAKFAKQLRELRDGLTRTDKLTGGLADLLGNGGHYLVLMGNNAEMRAGEGMFLSCAEMTIVDGKITIGTVRRTLDMILPDNAVPLTGDLTQLGHNWGFLQPSEEWRNLGVTPRFDVTAPLAARMWVAAGNQPVDGVIAVDVVALKALLGATGPIQVDGQTVSAGNVEQQLLLQQYIDNAPYGEDQGARREKLGQVAQGALQAFNDGNWDYATLSRELRGAADGRHLMAWSSVPAQEAGWTAARIGGTLSSDSLLVALVNRGSNKLDQFMHVKSTLTLGSAPNGTTAVKVQLDVSNETPTGLPRYVEGPNFGSPVGEGVYAGIATFSVPGSATSVAVNGTDYIVVDGPDGPTQQIGGWFTLPRGTHRSITLTFILPQQVRQLAIRPSARIPELNWDTTAPESGAAPAPWTDGKTAVVHWTHLPR